MVWSIFFTITNIYSGWSAHYICAHASVASPGREESGLGLATVMQQPTKQGLDPGSRLGRGGLKGSLRKTKKEVKC